MRTQHRALNFSIESFFFFKIKKKRMYQLTNERTNKKKIRTKNNIFFIYLYINKTEEVKEETQTPFSDY